MVTVVWQIWSMGCFFDCLPYEWRSGTSDGLFLPIYPPRSMRVVLGFWWLVDFCNKYVSSLWLMLSPWIIRTLTLPSLLASSVPCIALSHLESWCKLRRCIQTPWYDTLLFTYNSKEIKITTRYLWQSMTLYECLRRCTGMCNDLA